MLKLRVTNLFRAAVTSNLKCSKRMLSQTIYQFSDRKPSKKSAPGFEKFDRKILKEQIIRKSSEKKEEILNKAEKNEKDIHKKVKEEFEPLVESADFEPEQNDQKLSNEEQIRVVKGQKLSNEENIRVVKGFENFSRSKNKEKIIDKENREEENIIFVENKEEKEKEIKQDNIDLSKEEKIQNIDEEPLDSEEKKKENDKNKKSPKRQSSFQFNIKIDGKKDQKERNSKNEENKKQEENLKYGLKTIAFVAFGTLIVFSFFSEIYGDRNTITNFDFLKNYVDKKMVKSILLIRTHKKKSQKLQTTAIIDMKDSSHRKLVVHNLDFFLNDLENHQSELGLPKENFIPIEFVYKNQPRDFKFVKVALIGLSLYIIFTIFKSTRVVGKFYEGGSDLFGMGNSSVKIFGIDNNVKVRFKDVAGLNEAKIEISEFVDFLKQPLKYNEIGAKLPRGALLTGPPGTGKTMLAKACAGEAGVPFFYISGSDFVEMFVGVGASRVRDLFKQAKAKAPSIMFIDEIDAVGRKRDSKMGRSNDERDNTLNQLLVEMDGFGTNSQVVVLAATNRKELLDPALTRPGRFDRQIEVSLPDIEGRFSIFLVHLTPLKLNPEKTNDEYAKRLATLTPGFSGADIANLCNEAAILAARQSKKHVDTIDFELATERIIGGLERKKIISEEERKTIATHESGHAVVSWFLEGGNPLLKLTIIPRSKGSLGFAQYLPNESTLQTKEELLDQICCVLGGRCSEEFFFEAITTGAYDDLDKAYKIANAIVTKFGMSEEIGYIGFVEEEYKKNYSDYTQNIIDNEISKIISECTQRTRQLIKKYKDNIEKLRDCLLEKETLDLNSIIDILGERPFEAKSNFKAYLKSKREISAEASVVSPT